MHMDAWSWMQPWLPLLILGLLSQAVAAGAASAQESRAELLGNYRYAYSADGYNQDRDDVAGSAMALAILDRADMMHRLVHFHFNTNFGGPPTHAEEHRKSVLQTAVLFGHIPKVDDDDVFFGVSRSEEERQAAIAHLARAMRLSTANDRLMVICAGGVQVPYLAVKKAKEDGANIEALQSITFFSHAQANEQTRSKNNPNPDYRPNWDDLKALSPESRFIDYTSPLSNGRKDGGVHPSQNSTAWNQAPRSGRGGIEPWQWLKGYGEHVEGFGFSGTKGEWLLGRLKAAGAPELGLNGDAEGDASDAGMVFAQVPGGTTDASMDDIREFFLKEDGFHTEVSLSAGDYPKRLDFAIEEIKAACGSVQPKVRDLTVSFVEDDTLAGQAYRIGIPARGQVEIRGGDTLGLMYGGLRLAECILDEGGTETLRLESGDPFLPFRGLKMNIPLDARTPSYDDTGDSAVWNIPTMWDWSFWEAHLDAMARHRYNALTLWNPHPFPSLLKLEDFPEVALDDVCTTTHRYSFQDHPRRVHREVLESLETIKTLSIDEKIAFWRKVMAHAKDRGIDILFITWNIHLDGAFGKHGITGDQDNLNTIAYLRACSREMFATYPDLAGLGVTAGEMMTHRDDEFSKEKWLWKTYGLGIKDAKEREPGREIRFIHRIWESGLASIMDDFGNQYPGPFDVSMKYARARIYSDPRPPFVEGLLKEMAPYHVKGWWNLRNDDLYCLRWGDPEYVRAFIKNMPYERTAGFHMGSDGYVWARSFALRDPEQRGQMEIERHWYNFMLWGRLGYDPSLDRRLFEGMLRQHYPQVDAALLYDTWAASSKIMPQVNRFFFTAADFQFSPEACQGLREGFLTVSHFIKGRPMPGAKEISIPDFIGRKELPNPAQARTPLNVADNLDTFAEDSLRGTRRLRAGVIDPTPEVASILGDIDRMAWLGRYYASKIRGATHLARFQKNGDQDEKAAAVADLEDASQKWQTYAKLMNEEFRPQDLARGQRMDWDALAKEVEGEIAFAQSATPNN